MGVARAQVIFEPVPEEFDLASEPAVAETYIDPAASRSLSRPPLLGRNSECAVIDGLLADLNRGGSRCLLLRGEPGIGKTALLEYLVESARGLTVLRTAGAELEMELAYAAVQRLCVPFLGSLASLPAPQRQALEVVFGLDTGPAPDRLLVGLGLLSLLAAASKERPAICVIDDAQWLDQTSMMTLGFVSRRLMAESVGLVFATRETGRELRHLPELEVTPLGDSDARTLLRSAVRFRLDAQVRDRIVAESRGNPLALLELHQAFSSTELAGFGAGSVSTLPSGIEESFRRRIGMLPRDSRRLLLVAAADPLGDAAVVWSAAELLGIDVDAATPVLDAGLCEFHACIRFRHPLVRAAAYSAGSPEERRSAHAVLAAVTDAQADPDRRAWHRALASATPDDDVATELEHSAARARGRGGHAAAAAFLERSVELTLDPARRAERALAAAEARCLIGDGEAAFRFAAIAQTGPLSELDHIRLDVLRGRVATIQRRVGIALPLLLDSAQRLEPFDRRAAWDTYRDAFIAACSEASPDGETGLRQVSAVIRSPKASLDPPRVTDELLSSLALLVDAGYEAGAARAQRALAAFIETPLTRDEQLHWTWLGCRAAQCLWDNEAWGVLSSRLLELVRDSGAAGLLAPAAASRVAWGAFAGDLANASLLATEHDRLFEEIGFERSPRAGIVFAAYRGHEDEFAKLDGGTSADAEARGEGQWLVCLNWSKAILYNGLGRYQQALAAAQLGAAYRPSMTPSMWLLSELVEAAARTGQPQEAVDALERLDQMASSCGTDWILGVAARARALLAGACDVESLYRAAIDSLGRSGLRTEIARAHLVYGEWLRREGRRVAAREQLRFAHESFVAIGMQAFAERARLELLATGERARRRTSETRDDLTAQERQIAQLASDGFSNPQIGSKLFLSPRTVEWHLRKVFGKLGIRSRYELAAALAK